MSTEQITRDTAGFFAHSWARIVTTQPPAVRASLDAERRLADELVPAYRGLVEVGSADGSLLLPVALRHGLTYVGLDLAEGAVAATRAVLASARTVDSAATTGIALQADVCDLGTLGVPLAEPLLVAFPFNVFGNLPEPRRALAAAATVGADVLVLTYDTGPRAGAVRAEYYRACGLPGGLIGDELGVHFTSGAFISSVYHRPVLTGWLAEQGYQVTVRPYGAVGLAYHGVR